MTPQFALSPLFQLRPSAVYVMVAPFSRPGLCKIGRSFQATRRTCEGSTWLPDLAVAFEVAFLDGVSAETAAHIRFSKDRFVEGNGDEWFRVPPAEAAAYLRKQQDAQAGVRGQFDLHVRKALELGLLQSAASQVSNSALQAILNWKLPRQDVTALQASKAALSGTPAAAPAIALLEKAGLIPVLDEEVVLVNFTTNQPLVRYLDRTIGAQRWPVLLEDFAGFSKMGESVKMSEWSRRQPPKQAAVWQ